MTTSFDTHIRPDLPDSRDWIYRPSLTRLPHAVARPEGVGVRNQQYEGACTGFALAAAIDYLRRKAGDTNEVSARMLYEMAKRHDEWAGEEYEGSSLRGAIQGWKNMGVCLEADWPYRKPAGESDFAYALTVERAKAARNITLGAYYRLRPEITHFHDALASVGVIVASARVHDGWSRPDEEGGIPYLPNAGILGGHAFAVVGYNAEGFWVQNSWGGDWGQGGFALWRYEDWIDNVMDAWVFQVALPAPQIFGKIPLSSKLVEPGRDSGTGQAEFVRPTVTRDSIAGHFVHVDDGRFAKPDRYWSDRNDVEITASRLADKPATEYGHLLVWGHGGLNSPKAAARRIEALKPVFKENGIYPYHVMYDTGLAEELKDLVFRKSGEGRERAGGLADWRDHMVEHLARRPGTLVWEEMKRDAGDCFAPLSARERNSQDPATGAGTLALKIFIDKLRNLPASKRKQIHLVGHSTGAILFGHLLSALRNYNLEIASLHLLAPACRIDFYQQHYLPVLAGRHKLKIRDFHVYNLRDALERGDTVGSELVYGKSLLYLVSNAFERTAQAPLLGLEKFVLNDPDVKNLFDGHPGTAPQFHWSNGASSAETRSRTHGGFDNDPLTMNHILRKVLGQAPKRPFNDEDLNWDKRLPLDA